jgi:hypothetical protein
MAKGVKKSSLVTNLDVNLSPAQRKQAQVDEKNDALIQEAVEKSAKSGPSIDMLSQPGQQYATTYDRMAEQEAFASGDKQSLIPLAVQVGPQYPGGWHYVLSDADYDAVMAGVYCFRCLIRYPEAWAPACLVCGTDRDLLR